MDDDFQTCVEETESDLTDDEQEAQSIKYNVARIVKLSSGNFALFAPFDNDDGIRLITIGALDDLEPHIPTAEECTTNVQGIRDNESVTKADLVQGRNLLSALGLVKPEEPIKRRNL